MNTADIKVESGLQLLERLSRRPPLADFYPFLFDDGPNFGEVIEITGEDNSGKSLLLLDLVLKAVLPFECHGRNSGVILITTDGNFDMDTLNRQIELNLKKKYTKNYVKLFEEILSHIYLFPVYSNEELKLTIHKLDLILSADSNVSLVAIDTISAFYWSVQKWRLTKMDIYLKSILVCIQKSVKEYKLVIIYTKPLYFGTRTYTFNPKEGYANKPILEKLNYSILLSRGIDNNKAEVLSYSGSLSKTYKIINDTLLWF